MKNRQYSQFALLAMANRKHNEHRHIRSAIRELLAAELDLKNDGNGTGVGRLSVLDRVHEALAELRGIDEQIQLGNTAIADETQTARSCGCRLSDGDQTPEALSELFQDWQSTHTQSSVTVCKGLRQ